jgi:tyrosine-protein phosphatase YwqE
MLSIFKKKQPGAVDLSELGTDIHSHLLPGIDDGSPDVATSLRLIRGLQDLGYQRFVTTPHIMWDIYRNDADTIAQAYRQLEVGLAANKQNVILHTAAEYFLDEHFDQMLEKKASLLTIRDNWVLVEFSFVSPPLDFKEKIFDLQIKGYQPVLAHPERYSYFAAQKEVFDELHTAGCFFQVNLLSLAGYYGKGAQDLAKYFVKKQWIKLLGTDLHHDRHLHALRQAAPIMPIIKALLDSGTLLNPTIR